MKLQPKWTNYVEEAKVSGIGTFVPETKAMFLLQDIQSLNSFCSHYRSSISLHSQILPWEWHWGEVFFENRFVRQPRKSPQGVQLFILKPMILQQCKTSNLNNQHYNRNRTGDPKNRDSFRETDLDTKLSSIYLQRDSRSS